MIWDVIFWFQERYNEFELLVDTCRSFIWFLTRSQCFQKHLLYNWVGMIWFLWSPRFLDSLWEIGSDWDGFGASISILEIISYIRDVCEAFLLWAREILRHCEDNANVWYMTSEYLIWTFILWPLRLRLCADVWLLQWANSYSSIAVYYWIFAKRSSRTFCSSL